jgi:hypothetical protein
MAAPDQERVHRAGGYPLDYSDFFRTDDFFARLASANRFAVRFFAAAIDAFLARAERSSGVIVSRLRFPPFAPICAIA